MEAKRAAASRVQLLVSNPLAFLVSVARPAGSGSTGLGVESEVYQRRMQISPLSREGDSESRSALCDPFSCAVILPQLLGKMYLKTFVREPAGKS